MESLFTTLEYILGLSGKALNWWQIALRAVLIYAAGLALVRIGKRRFMGTYTAFDMILGITVGALLANAAADSEVFLNAIAIVFGLAVLHWMISFATYRWDWVGTFLIGEKEVIIEDSDLQLEGMRRRRISKSDIGQALRKAGLESVDEVKHAYLERNGELSVVPFEEETQNEGRKKESRPGEEDGTGKRPGSAQSASAEADAEQEVDREEVRSEGNGGEARSEARVPRDQVSEASADTPPDGRRASTGGRAEVVEIDVEDGVQRVVVEIQ